MNKCIFCEIINKRIPSKIVYENKKVLTFLDINPITKGHLLVIPKKHFESIYDIEDSYLEEIIIATKNISESLKKSLDATGINILHASGKDAQQSVGHFHIHIVPRYKDDNLDTWPKSNYKSENLEEIKEQIMGGLK